MDSMAKFILLITLEIPAIVCSIVILVYFAVNRQARSKIKNHGWIILLTVNFFQLIIDLPMPISYFHLNRVLPQSDAYCVWWTWFEFSVNTIGLFLMVWISIERHIFIFRLNALFQVPWKKWIFHYIPIILALIWTPIFYIVIVVISPNCTPIWDFNFVICGIPCYFTANFLGQFDFIFNIAIPVMIIMIANVTLVIRVFYQKISRHQVINWRRYRKMVLQLWVISSLYMAFWLPAAITQLIQITILPSFMIDQLETLLFLIYLIPLLLPMICLSTLPALVNTIGKMFRKAKVNVIGVTTANRGIGHIPINGTGN